MDLSSPMPDITLYMRKHGIRGGKGQTPLEKADGRLHELMGLIHTPSRDRKIEALEAEVDRLRNEEETYLNG